MNKPLTHLTTARGIRFALGLILTVLVLALLAFALRGG